MVNYTDVEFGNTDFWELHGIFFLIFITAFPRLTLIFSSVAFGGLFWWLGLFFAPRFLVAVLATISYWNTNKFLVIASWLIALGGESSEKYCVHRVTRSRTYSGACSAGGRKKRGKVIEAEYYKKED